MKGVERYQVKLYSICLIFLLLIDNSACLLTDRFLELERKSLKTVDDALQNGGKDPEIRSRLRELANDIAAMRKEIRQEANPFLVIKAERLSQEMKLKSINSSNTGPPPRFQTSPPTPAPTTSAVHHHGMTTSLPSSSPSSSFVQHSKLEKKIKPSFFVKNGSKDQTGKMDQMLATLLSPVFLPFVVLSPVVSAPPDDLMG